MADWRMNAVNTGTHLLVSIDNAIASDPAPADLECLASAYAQVVPHIPKGVQFSDPDNPTPTRGLGPRSRRAEAPQQRW